jgi:Stage II sporulation protein E (SpoIIE)/GAF domain
MRQPSRTEVKVYDDPLGTAAPGLPGSPAPVGPLAAAGLRLAGGTNIGGLAGLALDAVVPALADGATVCAAEWLLLGSPAGRDDPGDVAVRRLGARFTPDDGQVAAAAFPSGETLVLAADSPYVRCMRTGEPVIFTQPDGQTLERAHPGARSVFSGYASFLTVPMTAAGAAAGFLALARAPGRPAFGGSDAEAASYLAAHAGTGIANAVALTRLRTIADALQRGLQDSDPPEPELLEVAARCLPADGHLIGGDWYSITPLPAGRTGLVVGDVMGHGPEAAAVMAQLRTAARTLSQLDLPPAELLRQLDRVTGTLRDATLTTCVYAVIDPAGQSCTLAAAGHLPAVLALPDGTTRALDLPVGPSLGLGPGLGVNGETRVKYGEARVKLPPGTVIALYTDGLVETRTRSFEDGILTLRTELARTRGPLSEVCGNLVQTLAPRPDDDVTLILARIPARRE